MRNKGGFTLIELMIVTAIIAILAAVAVPNFMKFVAKTKRSEAKYNLEAIYKAEIAWFGEYNFFSNSFDEIRWRPEGTIYYYTFSVGTELYGRGTAPVAALPVVPAATQGSFTACAWGNIDNDTLEDVWYTNDRKLLVNPDTADDLRL